MNTAFYKDGTLYVLDQSKLPHKEETLKLKTLDDVADVIKSMKIRGAPLIGIVAAYGFCIGVREGKKIEEIVHILSSTRPTAVNLFWAIERMRKCAQRHREDIKKLEEEASRIHEEDEECCAKIGIVGEKLLEDEDSVLTHCNAGALATGGDGTALSIIYAAKKKGKKIKVYVDETRPLLQGARLTCFELLKRGIKPTLICDSLAPYLMKIGKIKKVIVGADRITRRGDVANKVGTYTLALSAKEHKIPFYVAAPSYSFDLSMEDGERIKIEERGKDEVKEFFGKKCCPEGVDVLNLAFDVTPASFVTAFVTECGIIYPPFEENIPSTLQ